MLYLKFKIMMKPYFHLYVTFLSRQLDNDDANDDENDIDIFSRTDKDRTYEIPGLLYFAQDAQVAHWIRNICTRKFHAQYLRKSCASWDFLLSMLNICARFSPPICNICAIYPQDLRKVVLFPNAQYIYARDLSKICARLYFFPQCAIYVQDLCKIVLLFPMCNMCTRLQAVLEEICHILHNCSKFGMVFTS